MTPQLVTAAPVSQSPSRSIATEGLADGKTAATGARRDLAHVGEPAMGAILIRSGWACRYRMLNDGRRQFVALLLPGDLDQLVPPPRGRRDWGVTAITTVQWSRIAHLRLSAAAADNAKLAARLVRDLAADVSCTAEWAVSLGRRNAAERIAHFCCEIYTRLAAIGDAADGRCAFPLTQMDLGEALGLTSVHVNRTLQALRARGLVQVRDRTLVIHDFAQLAAIGDFSPEYLHLDRD